MSTYSWYEIVAIVILVVLVIFGIDWLLTKGVIWVMASLFKIDWGSKFWQVFVGVIILQTLVGSSRR